MLLLALESAADTSSVAVWDTARPEAGFAFRSLEAARRQADRLVELCEEALAAAGLGYNALDLIAVDHGPGSFTGLRSAVAAARGFALAAGLPVLAVGSLEALAGAVAPRPGELVLAALDARRGQVYAQSFDADLAPLQDPWLATPEQVAAGLAGRPARLAGSGAA
ncbi:MAG: tRNA (adenosine(37)-N6)-threonylcarbamoyltransferase complex dimerization subunit type 1 TsaB, partial [Geminicoccaceae bacterium]